VIESLIEALLVLSGLMAGAAALMKASASRKLAETKRLETRLDDLDKRHDETRELVTKLEGYRNGYQNGRSS
jgi:hypothetical protein